MRIVWEEVSPEELQTDIESIRAASAEAPDDVLESTVEWVLDNCDDDSKRARVLVCSVDGVNGGYAVFLEHPTAFRYSFGEVDIFKYKIRRLALSAGIRLGLLDLPDSTREALFLSLFEKMHDVLGRRKVAFLLGIGLDSELGEFVVRNELVKKLFHILPHGPEYERRLIKLPDSYEAYLGQLARKTRENVRRAERKLTKLVDADIRLQRYTSADDVASFLEAAEPISRKSYQWQLLGMGVANHEGRTRRLTAIAARGWFQSYVLFCGNEPTAFMIGYVYGKTYFSSEIGYDPDWIKWSVGNILHCFVVRDLLERGCPAGC